MLEGKPAGESDAVTMSAIKSILADHESEFALLRKSPNRTKRRARATTKTVATLQPVRSVETKVKAARFTSVPAADEPEQTAPVLAPIAPAATDTNAQTKAPKARPARKLPRASMPKPDFSRIKPYLTPRNVALGVFVAVAILQPSLVVLTVCVLLFAVVGAFLALGADQVWDTVSEQLARYDHRNPAKAARLRARLDAIAVRWDAVLDLFPEGFVDGLYMPDFAARDEARARHDAVVAERLSRMHQQV